MLPQAAAVQTAVLKGGIFFLYFVLCLGKLRHFSKSKILRKVITEVTRFFISSGLGIVQSLPSQALPLTAQCLPTARGVLAMLPSPTQGPRGSHEMGVRGPTMGKIWARSPADWADWECQGGRAAVWADTGLMMKNLNGK